MSSKLFPSQGQSFASTRPLRQHNSRKSLNTIVTRSAFNQRQTFNSNVDRSQKPMNKHHQSANGPVDLSEMFAILAVGYVMGSIFSKCSR